MRSPLKLLLGLCVGAAIFAAGYLANRHPEAPASSSSSRKILYYACPMHPAYRSDHPGDAPCCGMRLVPVYEGGDSGVKSAAGTVSVNAVQQQLIGIRTERAERSVVSRTLKLPGRIAVDEGRLYRVIAATDGWVRELGQNTTGTFVRENDVLASYYARDLLSSGQALLFAMQTNAQSERAGALIGSQRGPTTLNLQVAIDSLRGLGMSERQIDEIRRTGAAPTLIHVYSPVTGYVLSRSISPAQRFDKGSELYRVADLSHVWIMTDLFEKDSDFAKPGAVATVRYQGHEFRARMSDVLAQLDPQARTLKTRFECDNPGLVLRPDTFVDVELAVDMPPAVTLPAEALIDSGNRTTVYVRSGDGLFEPRTIQTGWRLGDRVQVTRGIEPGETVVVAGNFLLDSESRMNAAAGTRLVSDNPATRGSTSVAGIDPVCGMEVEKAPGAIKLEYRGKTFWFCSKSCRQDFEAAPQKYLSGTASAREPQGSRGPA